MKVYFDDQIFHLQKFGGISRYFSEIIKGIDTKSGIEVVPRKFFSNNIHLRENNLVSFKVLSGMSLLDRGRVRNYIYKLQLNKTKSFLKEKEFDIYHPTYYDTAFLEYIQPQKPLVVTVHDMIHEIYFDKQEGAEHYETRCKRKLLPLAGHIIAVSQSTKNDIIRFFPEVDPGKISVAYHGHSFLRIDNRDNTIVKLPLNYLLFVGKRETYKNFLWFIESVSELIRDRNLHVVCAGGGLFTKEEEYFLRKNKIKDKVIHVGIRNDNELAAMYKRALCFVFPSFYEGFGIPILEAFACGCPVVLSSSSSFPEVGGNAALYFELNDAEALRRAILDIIENIEVKNELKAAGYERLALFSWENSITKHQLIYHGLFN